MAQIDGYLKVSTHSRPKAAGGKRKIFFFAYSVSTHSRPKAAGYFGGNVVQLPQVSTHSRPKAAGRPAYFLAVNHLFQHTAARRRLAVSAQEAVDR